MESHLSSSSPSSSAPAKPSRQPHDGIDSTQGRTPKRPQFKEPEVIMLSDSDEESPSDQKGIRSARTAQQGLTGNVDSKAIDTKAIDTPPPTPHADEIIDNKVIPEPLVKATGDATAKFTTRNLKANPPVKNVDTSATTGTINTRSINTYDVKYLGRICVSFDLKSTKNSTNSKSAARICTTTE
ncbi:uncharacterized protein Z520_05842 [Fonsecaea multimorphosa CBS 102226]|uniref:Uncharacterized protein n=1 Tax=Fonsecaea multimorphosa CBS 102226 TaxID=1442371 RepID=A0A0D2IND7_9EURO|nr:uncharacterized protein Z520_05842 [Fonsecaea multimorphosa CBS 102226]KIX98541.1 hypothetical protein Z520_05842 [Fonsecaea multimorphosa CBS 102226]